ncbi:substrate-binding domain-containing protein [Rhodococcus fascians]|nr:substrate-binding domain-containing protein [Rhodococcus fascians]MBY4433105.1 substrate-binding domain-containing protein [Rhodococcus fascians]
MAGEPDAAGLEWAASTVAEASARPAEIPVTTPIAAKIPTAKTILWINAGAASSNLNKRIYEQATELLGWKLTIINTDGSAGETKNAWEQAVQQKPDAVLDSGSPKELFASELAQLQAQGTLVVVNTATFEAGDGIIAVLGGIADAVRTGELLGAWLVDDSQGAGSALVVNSPSYDYLNRVSTSVKDTVAQRCPTCSTESMDVSFAQLANVNSQIVAYLSSHRDVQYVVLSTDNLGHGLSSALAAAGLSDVKIIGAGPDDTSWGYLKSGATSADITFGYYEIGFSMIDALARSFAGVDLPEYPHMPLWLMTPSAVKEIDEFPFPVVPDYLEQFKTAWNIA